MFFVFIHLSVFQIQTLKLLYHKQTHKNFNLLVHLFSVHYPNFHTFVTFLNYIATPSQRSYIAAGRVVKVAPHADHERYAQRHHRHHGVKIVEPIVAHPFQEQV